MRNKMIGLVLLAALLFCCGCQPVPAEEIPAAPAAEVPRSTAVPAPASLDLSNSGLQDQDLADLKDQNHLLTLDLRGNSLSAAAVRDLQDALPSCSITWSIPIGSETYDSSSRSVSVSEDVPASELEALLLFPNLVSVDLTRCSDTAAVLSVAERLPDTAVAYSVRVLGSLYPSDTQSLDLSSTPIPDCSALAAELRQFPSLKEVNLSGQVLSEADRDLFISSCPGVFFLWQFELAGVPVSSDQTEINLSGKKISDPDLISRSVRHLPALTKLDLCNTGLTDEQMDSLVTEFPSVKFVWIIHVGGWQMRTDVKAFSKGNRRSFEGGKFLGGKTNFDDETIQPLKYCTDLVALDLGHGNRITDLSILQYFPKLRFLIVAMNDIEDLSPLSYCPELEYVETFQNDISDWTPFLSLPKLTHLNCSTNYGKDAAGNKVYPDYRILMQIPTLERLWILRCGLSESQLAELKAALPNCVICTKGSDSTDNGWRDNPKYREMQDLFNLPYSK